MRQNKLTIQINKPTQEVFSFLLNPKNTPLWIEHLVFEEINEWPVKVGTVYRNKNREGEWAQYTLTELKQDEMFEMTSKDGNYHVRYTFRPLKNGVELEYYERVDQGELAEPFTFEILQKLKLVLES